MAKTIRYFIPLCIILIVITATTYIGARHKYGELIYVSGEENHYSILIDAEISQLTVFKDGAVLKVYPCAGGKRATPSPIGRWKITEKHHWGGGFGGKWFGLNVPWGTYGIHGTIYPESIGRNSSHGCIRMKNKDIDALFAIIPIGTTVTIIDGSYGVWGRGFRILKPGMCGADVLEIQKKLKEIGYYTAVIDGKYGKAMIAAVHRFQKAANLEIDDVIKTKFLNQLGFVEWE